MFSPIQIVIDAFVEQLQKQYEQTYGMLEPGNPGMIGFIARLARVSQSTGLAQRLP